MLRISNVKLRLEDKKENIKRNLLKTLNISEDELINYSIYKESIDARDKGDILFVYTLDLQLKNEKKVLEANEKILRKIEIQDEEIIEVDLNKIKASPVIIGFGPAGIFAALTLAKKGLNPIVFERGEAIDDRVKSVDEFWKKGILNTESNVQFGEGGAGTFSDGKLTARVKKKHSKTVLEELVKHGADEKIMYMANPHIGTDVIRTIVKSIRKEIEKLGGTVNFNCKLTDIKVENSKVTSIIINDKEQIEVEKLIIAIGHSARDTFELFNKKEVSLSPKEFAVGFRVEHKQELINLAQYGKHYNHPALPPAEYKLTYISSNGRGVYTFCMCPGGYVVASVSQEGTVVTNGMSYSKRDGVNANSAIVVQVKIEDFKSDSSLGGMKFQQDLEKKAFELGGSNYKAPFQTISNFLGQNEMTDVRPTYSNGAIKASLKELLPDELYKSIKEGLRNFDKKIKGFNTGILTGIETRTSSPIRINREKDYVSASINNLYPVGEGSGYSGGIVTSAIDGIKGANEVLKKYL